jgi:hypothetical protein
MLEAELFPVTTSMEQISDWGPDYISRLERDPGHAICHGSAFSTSNIVTRTTDGFGEGLVDKIVADGHIRVNGTYCMYEYNIIPALSPLKFVIDDWKLHEPDWRALVKQRSRGLTAFNHPTQMIELEYHHQWVQIMKPRIQRLIDVETNAPIWKNFVKAMRRHYKPKINPWYLKRTSHVLPGVAWKDLNIDSEKISDATDYITASTTNWYNSYDAALDTNQWVDMPKFNFGGRNRPFDSVEIADNAAVELNKLDIADLSRELSYVEECDRSRIVAFQPGPSTGGSGCDCDTEDDHTTFMCNTMNEIFKTGMNASNIDGPLFSGAQAYAHLFGLLEEGWKMRCIDGMRWESSVASLLQYLASGVSTKIAEDCMIEASGTIFTSDINTFAWLCILDSLHILGRTDVWFFVHSDDLNVVAKNAQVLNEICHTLLSLGIADEDEGDSHFGFYLGMVHLKHNPWDVIGPMGIKFCTDAADATAPLKLNEDFAGSYTDIERQLIAELYTGKIHGVPTLNFFKGKISRAHQGIKEGLLVNAVKALGIDVNQVPHLGALVP